MSSSPKYSPVAISAARQRELDAQRAAARRRMEEAERQRRDEIMRRLEAERRERRERIERRRAEIELRRQERAEAARQRIEAAQAGRARRLEEAARPRDAAAGHREAQPDRREHHHEAPPPELPPANHGFDEVAPAVMDARTAVALEELGQRAGHALARSVVLLAEGARHAHLAGRLAAVQRAAVALEHALTTDDEPTLAAALGGLDAALHEADREHAETLAQEARRRTIAHGVARALPDRYVHNGAFTEGPDGSIHFAAYALDQELRIAVVGDGAGGEVIACQTEGHVFETRLEDGVSVADCPGLAAELEATNERLRHDGFVPGTWTWPGAAREPDAGGRAKRRLKPSAQDAKRSGGP